MEGTPNGLAYFALFAFIPFGLGLFSLARPSIAALLVFLLSYMFLPEIVSLDLPGFPGFGKQEVAALTALLGCLLRARRKLWAARPLRGPDLLILLLFVGDILTALTNRDPIAHGPTHLPGLSLHEGISLIIYDSFHYFIPFLLGRALFVTTKDVRQLLAAMALAAAAYTPFLFIEIMMSPQMNVWIYGFHQHSFLQTLRGGGYRPMVFMPHGLAVGLFMAQGSMAALLLFRLRKAVLGLPSAFVGAWDFGFLIACKSLGAAVYTLAMGPVLWLLRPKGMVRIASILAALVLTYPVLRATSIFPEQGLVSVAKSVAGGARAQSLAYRFHMETVLSDHARERPLFGWGRFRRNMVFDDYTGRDVSVSDGFWIVTYSIRGAWGFICSFLLILSPIFYLRRRLRRITEKDERLMLAGLACIYAVGAVDLLPNALQNVITLFVGGALYGATRSFSLARSEPPEPPLEESPS